MIRTAVTIARKDLAIEWRTKESVPAMALLITTRESAVGAPTAGRVQPQAGGLAAAMRQRQFWLLAVIFFVSIVGLNGTLTHLVAMLSDRGMAPKDAAGVLSVALVAR